MTRLRTLAVLATLFALAGAFFPNTSFAQETRDPLIDPPSGGAGSRFQIVGQAGWVAGETVQLTILYTTGPDPLTFTSGLYEVAHQVTVLRDGTWSFPVVVNDALFGTAFPDEPGYIVVRATSGARTAVNAYVYTVNGTRPAGAETIAPLGFGPGAPPAGAAVVMALFAAGTGVLLVVSGCRRGRAFA